MAAATRTLICGTLKDLDPEQLANFCASLRERRGDGPRVRRADVEGKSPLELSELLVQTFCKDGAVSVTVQLLRDIGCMDTAEELESTKAGVCHSGASSKLPSEDAVGETRVLAVRTDASVRTDANVMTDANIKTDASVQSELSRKQLVFGKYEEQSFEWLLQTEPHYAVYVAATHLKEREEGNKSHSSQMTNKDDLAQYVKLKFPKVWTDVLFYKKGLAPVGFGKYSKRTLEALYSSTNKDHKSYVRWMRSIEDSKRDSQMEAAVNFFIHRDDNPYLYRVVSPTKPKKRAPSGTRFPRSVKKRR